MNATSITVFSDDFEGGTGAWTIQGTWATTNSTSHQGCCSLTDSPAGNYTNNTNASAQLTNPMDLSGTTSASLVFWHRYAFETTYDHGYVEISIGGGAWSQLAAYNGTQTAWTQMTLTFPASAIGQSNVQLRFRINSDYTVTRDGWYLDDLVVIKEIPVEITTPASGTVLAGGSIVAIAWIGGDGLGASGFRLTYSTDNGATYPFEIADGIASSATSYDWTVPLTDNATVRVRLEAVNASGVILATAASPTFSIDSSPPFPFELLSPGNGEWASPTPTFSWSAATDEVSAVGYELWIDEAPVVDVGVGTTFFSLPTASALVDGAHTWTVHAYDEAGHDKAASMIRTVWIESSPPDAFELGDPADDAWVSWDLPTLISWTLSADTESGLSGYRLYIDGVPCGDQLPPGQTLVVTADLFMCRPSEGDHRWTVGAEDVAGNMRWGSELTPDAGRLLHVDNLPPGATRSVVVQVSANATPPTNFIDTGLVVPAGNLLRVDATGTWCFLDNACCDCTGCVGPEGTGTTGGLIANCPLGALAGWLPDKTYFCIGSSYEATAGADGTLMLGVNDNDQLNCADRAVTARAFVFDAPLVTITPADGEFVASESGAALSWTPVDDYGVGFGSYDVLIDGTEVASGLSIANTIAAVTSGPHEWQVRASDLLGNAVSSPTATFTADAFPPAPFSLSSPANGQCVNLTTPTFCWEAASDAESSVRSYQLFVDSAAASGTLAADATCAELASPLEPGSHTWSVVAEDQVGQQRTSDIWTVVVETESPPIPPRPDAPASESTVLPDAAFAWTPAADDGAAHYEVWVDFVRVAETIDTATVTVMPSSPLSLGPHLWQVAALAPCGTVRTSGPVVFTVVECSAGTVEVCSTGLHGACTAGERTCGADSSWGECAASAMPQTETCDGLDNDCNDVVDEGFDVGTPCSAGFGACTAYGIMVCNGDGSATVCDAVPGSPLLEACNGIDDDCDTLTDEDFPVGTPCSVGVGSCARSGMLVCSLDGTTTVCPVESGPPSPEICNNLDDDCDGFIDLSDGVPPSQACYTGPPETFGIGRCEAGTLVCLDGVWNECIGDVTPSDEICNDWDDDCDGQADEGFPLGIACRAGLGTCAGAGVTICRPDGEGVACGAVPAPPAGESCDGFDNDCDGSTDEGCACAPGTILACGINIGECRVGTQVCTASIGWTACDGAVFPSPEVCDGLDNDCDGVLDLGCPCFAEEERTCGIDEGACSSGTQTCIAGKWGRCQNATPPMPELCDGLDNDCDGEPDQSGGLPSLAQTCYDGTEGTVGVGVCRGGSRLCNDGSWSDCEGQVTPSEEVCNGQDDDCDGETDEPPAVCMFDAGPVPEPDAGSPLPSSDAGEPPSEQGGCGCRVATSRSPVLFAASFLLCLAQICRKRTVRHRRHPALHHSRCYFTSSMNSSSHKSFLWMLFVALLLLPSLGMACRRTTGDLVPSDRHWLESRIPSCDLDNLAVCPRVTLGVKPTAINHPTFGKIVPGEVLVNFKEDAPEDEVRRILSALPGRVVAYEPLLSEYEVHLDSSIDDQTFKSIIERLNDETFVEAANPNYVFGGFRQGASQ